ncbi:MAG: hypothetical protein F4103_16375 [Boseongicola sp. SB0673_bin_14]|nr:hypothetical protein [Boseongicola sp. SB0673_bin_14]
MIAQDEFELIEVEIPLSCPLDQGIHDAPVIAVHASGRGQEIDDSPRAPFLGRFRQEIGDGVEAQVQHALK